MAGRAQDSKQTSRSPVFTICNSMSCSDSSCAQSRTRWHLSHTHTSMP